jgi:CRP/FNR family transcriptional regulator, anaerobic regulatory protein
MQLHSPGTMHFIDLISRFIPEETAALETTKQYIKPRKVRKNELLLQAGSVCKKIIFVSKGTLYMYRNADGKESVVEFYVDGMPCSDYVSFIRQAPADNSIKALEDSEVEELSYEDLHHLYDTLLPIERVGRIITEILYCGITKRMLSYQNDSPEVRYRKLVEERPILFKRGVPQYLIASILGVTPVGLSKIRKRLGLVAADH